MKKKIESDSVKKSKGPLFVSGLIVTGIVSAYFFVPSVQSFFDEAWQVLSSNDEAKIESWVSGFGWIGPLVLVLSMVIQMFLLVIPSLALMIVSVLAYGPFFGSLIIFTSIFTASTVGYLIGRYIGPVIVKRLIGFKTEKRISAFIEDYGFWAVFITRLNPILSNDAISFVAGILKMGYWKFMGATLLGIAPLTIFIAILGETPQGVKTGLIWGSFISLLLFLLYVWWDRNKRSKAT